MSNKKTNKNWPLIFTFFVFVILFSVVGYKLFAIQQDKNVVFTHTPIIRYLEAPRGNILAEDGRIMSITMPVYDIRLDLYTIDESLFNSHLSSLSSKLSELFKDKSPSEYSSLLYKNKNERYFLLKRNVSYVELQELKKFPIFRLGKNKGGFISEMKSNRDYPFGSLCKVTIGRVNIQKSRNGGDSLVPKNGIELAFNEYLQGTPGQQMLQEISDNFMVPKVSDKDILPKAGLDVVTSINIDFQDAAESALRDMLETTKAEWGSVILMEVKTGRIKAISNLHRSKDSIYFDSKNHAIVTPIAPGSTFKLASMIALLEDNYRDIEDIIDLGKKRKYVFEGLDYGVEDLKVYSKEGKLTLGEVFVVSSNIGIAKTINECYSLNKKKFISRLELMGLTTPLDLEFSYSDRMLIKKDPTHRKASSKQDQTVWWGSTLPAMSIGYEMKLSPLHMLTFYNAFANNGKMVSPQLVTHLKDKDKIIKSFPVKTVVDRICSQETIDKILPYMEEVISNQKEDDNDKINGTANNIYTDEYSIAGKTGTCEVKFWEQEPEDKERHSASFIGFFPSKEPKYSCMVIIYDFIKEKKEDRHAGKIAAPVFKEISDKVFAFDPELKRSLYSTDDLQYLHDIVDSIYVNNAMHESTLYINTLKSSLDAGNIPDLTGMNSMDAMYLLENAGYKVDIIGSGRVTHQTVDLDKKRIILELF